MYAMVRRYEGIDMVRSEQRPALQETLGFSGYYLIAAGGVLTSVGLFESAAQAEESARVAGQWVRDAKLEFALPNPPAITAGPVIAEGVRALAGTNDAHARA
jgi:hypothetical protein